jgi:hypothetical protein
MISSEKLRAVDQYVVIIVPPNPLIPPSMILLLPLFAFTIMLSLPVFISSPCP